MNKDPFYKKLSHWITREGSKIPFYNDYVYKFRCTQFLEDVDDFSDMASFTHNEYKQIVIDQLVNEFKISLNSVIFGDPAGKEYVESLENKSE
jgi:hypothetical protein